jgi:polysaccharide deacetylase family protein (PEP-CTERM system associated)
VVNTVEASSFILSFDIEEHDRIEAAAQVKCSPEVVEEYARRMESTTRKLLEILAESNTMATFYIVGQIAETHPKLVREIADAGHEIGTHSHTHKRVHRFNPQTFAEDIRISVEKLEQASGQEVSGFRAPTFSVVRKTAWAIDVLAEQGLTYDSSIFPVRHDRYGIPDAPRTPFIAVGQDREILELPPATYRFLGQNLPVAGGGYFRLLPLAAMRAGLSQLQRKTSPAVGMLYFHPWEFDPDQPRLPLGRVSKFRTYVGIHKSVQRLTSLLESYRFRRAIDVVNELHAIRDQLPRFRVSEEPNAAPVTEPG